MSQYDISENILDELSIGTRSMVSRPFLFAIAQGTVPGHDGINKFGHNSAVAATLEEIWDGSAVYTGYLTSASILEAASADIDDQGNTLSTGTSTGGTTSTLIDTGATFSTDTVAIGDIILNDTDNTFGYVTAVTETVLTFEGAEGLADFSVVGKTYRVVNANDTGAAVIEVEGLDANWATQKDFIVLNGQTDVLTTNTYLRVFRVKVLLAGGSGWNEGNIDIDNAGNSILLARIVSQFNQTLMAMWTVPANKTAFLTRAFASSDSNLATEIHVYVRPFGSIFQIKRILTILNVPIESDWEFPLQISARSDVKIMATAAGGGGNVSAGFDLWFENA